MKVIVLGAGVVGTTTAWYLAEAGHQVTVIDRQPSAGMETSFANGGQISPCHAEPWANPAVLLKLAKWLGREDAPLVFRFKRWDPALWAWGLRFLANCPPGRTEINTARTLRVALYSRTCLQQLRPQLGLKYDHLTRGILHVYTEGTDFDHAVAAAQTMAKYGLDRQVQTPEQCCAVEPALTAASPKLAGGIYTPDDESGDAHLFTQELAAKALAAGVEFQWNTTITAIEKSGDSIDAVVTDKGRVTGDAYVLALGSFSPLMVHSLGLNLPIVPAKGYSLTVPVGEHLGAPTVSITDDARKIVLTRLGQRLRIAGTAEMAGWDLSMTELRWRMQLDRAQELFPDGGDYDRAEPWAGLRAVTPDSVPILGPTPMKNLWLNTGHGTLGWTMACGCGRILADLISGKTPEISLDGLSMDRF